MGLRDRLVFRTAVPRSARRAARVIVVSEQTKRDLIGLAEVPAERVVVVPNGVAERFRPDGPLANGRPYALVVGSLERRKDPLTAVEGFALLGSDELRLVFAGPDRGDGAAARAAAARRGIEARVEFKGHVSEDELAALYRGAACLVFPSRDEGFGLPLLEAMASGVPVVASRAGALPEIAGDAAILVDPGNPVALAGGIERALADRERLVAAGLERARAFSWAETAERTLAVYRELVAC
jgi:glycosyltransferase involved in cell wall biosynthesis